jgi:hypothetical protein
MTTDGIEAVFLETHNWGRAAKFFQSLGFGLEFSTDHNSGQLRHGDGPYVFIVDPPFISFYTPPEMLTLAREAGFGDVRHVPGASLAERYFAGRTDGLRPSSGEDFLVATTGGVRR